MTTKGNAYSGSKAKTEQNFVHRPVSDYIVPAYYDWLDTVSTDLSSSEVRSNVNVTNSTINAIQELLTTEARLLDQNEYSKWLDLYADQCVYWIPSERPASNLREVISIEFHDRRRMLDRATRLTTGLAYSQLPPSRTSRVWSGLEIWPSKSDENEWRARYNFHIVEYRAGHQRTLAGWSGFVINESNGKFEIVLKQVNLVDCDQPQGNNSFFL